jgi:hypothetical protein
VDGCVKSCSTVHHVVRACYKYTYIDILTLHYDCLRNHAHGPFGCDNVTRMKTSRAHRAPSVFSCHATSLVRRYVSRATKHRSDACTRARSRITRACARVRVARARTRGEAMSRSWAGDPRADGGCATTTTTTTSTTRYNARKRWICYVSIVSCAKRGFVCVARASCASHGRGVGARWESPSGCARDDFRRRERRTLDG